MDLSEAIFLFFVALLAGSINAVAGGGGLLVFPALLFAGLLPLNANATSATIVWVGSLSSTIAYRQELVVAQRSIVWQLTLVTTLGAALGAWLLLHFSNEAFSEWIPYLLLLATTLFAFGPLILKQPFLKRFAMQPSATSDWKPLVIQSLIAIYGGFFGGGAGILMLGVLGLLNLGNIHTLNGFKAWLATCINAVAIVQFVRVGIVAWPQAILMASGTALGGYSSALIAHHISPQWIRYFVIGVGYSLGLYFFMK